MPTPRPTAAALPPAWRLPVAALLALVIGILALAIARADAPEGTAGLVTIERVLSASVGGDRFPAADGRPITLPDDWAETRPRYDGSVWYRAGFDVRGMLAPNEPLALYVERACGSLTVQLNGHVLLRESAGSGVALTGCHYPRLITLPPALLQAGGNAIDVQLRGRALHRVTARQRAGGLSPLTLGPQAVLAERHASRSWWAAAPAQAAGVVLAVLGCMMLAIAWAHRRQQHFAFFGGLLLGWAMLCAPLWMRGPALQSTPLEWLEAVAFGPMTALAVLFLLSGAGLRAPLVRRLLVLQCVLMPLSLLATGSPNLFVMSSVWYVLFGLQTAVAGLVYLRVMRRQRRGDFLPMAVLLGGVALVLLAALGTRHGPWEPPPGLPLLELVLPLLLIGIAVRLIQMYARALREAEAGRSTLEGRVREITAEIERNFAQLAELRVEQVTEKERKRIAADLHDDLGAKLLTIVHTSESERISTLAREALEEMRLSVRGLTGKPMRLSDALADWRAETVLRLGQANIEADWRSPPEEIDHLLPARGFVQTTRILREAVSNIIKHSGATQCKVRCAINEREFGLMVQDNGRGIPMELDGKLDRGHGMSSMKHRAKQMQGQCLVESGPGYGTVIRLTLPL